MSAKIKFIIFLLFSLIFVLNANAQPKKDTLTLDSRYYLEKTELQKLIKKLQNPEYVKLFEGCREQECPKVLPYENDLWNLMGDLYTYQNFMLREIEISKETWNSYVSSTIKNEDYKRMLQLILMVKDGLSQASSILMDVVSLHSLLTSQGAISNKTIAIIIGVINNADGILSSLNIIIKYGKFDFGTDTITEVTGSENWANFYSALKTAFDLILEAAEYSKKTKGLNPAQLANLNSQTKFNILAAITQILSIWSSDERQRMKKAIDDLDKELKGNQDFYSQAYQRYTIKRKYYNFLNSVRKEASKAYDKVIRIDCFDSSGAHTDTERPSFKNDKNNYGKGLRYYRNKVAEYIPDTKLKWPKLKSCPPAKPYQISVKDGIGKEFKADISIHSRYTGQQVFEGLSIDPIKLYPGFYKIDVMETIGSEGIEIANAYTINFEINGKEKTAARTTSAGSIEVHLAELALYGRVKLEVVDINGEKIKYSYSFNTRNKTIALNGTVSKDVSLDLPANQRLDLVLDPMIYKIEPTEIDGILLEAGKLKTLRYLFDGADFLDIKPNEYAFKIFDGIGEEQRTAHLEIIRNKDQKSLFKNVVNAHTKVKLAPGEYTIHFPDGYNSDMVMRSKASIHNFVISGEENSILDLKAYGRLQVKVVDENGDPKSFRYKIYDKNKNLITYSFTESLKPEIVDLPANQSLILEIISGFDSDSKEGLVLTAGQLRHLRFVFDDGKFTGEKEKTVNNPPENPNSNTKPVTLKESPEEWVSGVLYNSNDGDCDNYKGKYMVFEILNRDIPFFNRETGKYNQTVVVAPGESLHIAIPENNGHFNVSPLDVLNNSNKKERHVSFWYYRDLVNGWWYAAGCENGTRPASYCDNGQKNNNGSKPQFCDTVNN